MYIQQLDDLFDAFSDINDNPQAFLISYLNFDTEIKKLQAIDFTGDTVDREKWRDRILAMPRELPEIYRKVDTLPQYK